MCVSRVMAFVSFISNCYWLCLVLFASHDESGMFCLELDGNILFVSHEVVTSSWTALEDGLESSCLMIFSMMLFTHSRYGRKSLRKIGGWQYWRCFVSNFGDDRFFFWSLTDSIGDRIWIWTRFGYYVIW